MTTAYLCRGCGTPYTMEKSGINCDCGLTDQKPLRIDESRSYWLLPKLFNGARVEYVVEGDNLLAYEGHRTPLKRYVSMFWRLVGTNWVYDDSQVA